ncbi:MAG: hypothetical protein BWX54_02006 [Verrucomicrobia bacterium ADurb.Bin018]|nr:MAG: hypothetical protein BWX54_02006 [Verrucomicrobia bacterium ADurb.Bin018]
MRGIAAHGHIRRHAGGIIIGAAEGVELVVVGGTRRHHMLQRGRAAAINHRGITDGAAHAVAGAIGGIGHNGAGFVQDHHVAAGAVLGPGQAHHFMAVNRGRLVGGIRGFAGHHANQARPVGGNAHFVKIHIARRAGTRTCTCGQSYGIHPAHVIAGFGMRYIPRRRLIRRHCLRANFVRLGLGFAGAPIVVAHDDVIIPRSLA